MPVTDPVTQVGIDQVNDAGRAASQIDPFANISGILEGKNTARVQRPRTADLCDAVLPGGAIPSTSDPALNVTISPNSFTEGSNQVSQPFVTTPPLFVNVSSFIAALQANPSRQRFMIQNLSGTANLFLIFGKASQFGGNITTAFHFKLVPGQTLVDDLWNGRIDLVADASGGTISVSEFTRVTNVSQ
jgi:hypothetical protein